MRFWGVRGKLVTGKIDLPPPSPHSASMSRPRSVNDFLQLCIKRIRDCSKMIICEVDHSSPDVKQRTRQWEGCLWPNEKNRGWLTGITSISKLAVFEVMWAKTRVTNAVAPYHGVVNIIIFFIYKFSNVFFRGKSVWITLMKSSTLQHKSLLIFLSMWTERKGFGLKYDVTM